MIDRGGFTVIVSVAMSTAAVGVCESVMDTLKVVEPREVAVPLMMPPVLRARPGGSVPDASAQVNGPLPPVEVSVGEIRNIDHGSRNATGLMTRGPTATGSLPLPQEMANPHNARQIRRKKRS